MKPEEAKLLVQVLEETVRTHDGSGVHLPTIFRANLQRCLTVAQRELRAHHAANEDIKKARRKFLDELNNSDIEGFS